jgi:peptidyl-tRNA hydrolase
VLRSWLDSRSGRQRTATVAGLTIRPGLTVLIGAVGGLVVGMTSVGSGSLMIVLLLFAYPLISARQLVGTDLTQAVPLTAAAALGALAFGHVEFGVTTAVVLGSVPAVLIGSLLSSRAPDRYIRPVITLVIFASGLKYAGLGTPELGWTLGAVTLAAGGWWLLRARSRSLRRAEPQPPAHRVTSVTSPEAADRPDPRDANPQYALPLVIRVERAAPPARTDALEGAARAVLMLLADPRAADEDGEWAPAIRAWTDGRIRKVVRRARGAAWERAAELPGITVAHRSAEVRVYPPVPVDDWPPELARLQVSGTDFSDPESPPAPSSSSPVLWITPDIPMTAGKAMAQVGHAAQLAWMRLAARERAEWAEAGFDLAVRRASPARWRELLASGLPVVRDGGFTEVAPGSQTVVAELPALRVPR